ncbi:hypothetical protein [Neolewinella agarilytica]|uniref:hypothetical protein n=1 Tax=Neolewinella agarilytica TaxID=478744 RepID=UPI0023522D14|nr:hypothetical protein [Neolewinella agarilytica]
MLKYLSFLLFLCLSTNLSAQFYDNHWMMGYFGGDESSRTDSFGISILSYFDAELQIENNQEIDLFFYSSGSSLSDFDGNQLLFSNNLEIRDAEDQVILNGTFESNGDPEKILPQSFVCLPFDFTDIVQYVQMTYTDDFPRLGKSLSSSIIRTGGTTIGIFEQIDNILIDSLSVGQLTGCRHANGRDWWLLAAKANKAFAYSVLLNSNGVAVVDTMEVAYSLRSGLGQSVFSPNGKTLSDLIYWQDLTIWIFSILIDVKDNYPIIDKLP